jgi:hypothetical protein
LLADVGVGAAFIWALIEPPHIETVPYRSRKGLARRLLSRLVPPFALGDYRQVVGTAATAARTPDATGCLLAAREASR